MSGSRARSSAFLLEFVIILLVFSLSSAVCVRLFATARALALETTELDCAVAAATTVSETVKASDGSNEALGEILGASGMLFYDASWQRCELSDAAYVIRVELESNDTTAGRLVSGTFTVSGADGGEIYSQSFARLYPYVGEALS